MVLCSLETSPYIAYEKILIQYWIQVVVLYIDVKDAWLL